MKIMQLIWFLVLLVVFLHLPDLYNLLPLHLDTAEHTSLGNQLKLFLSNLSVQPLLVQIASFII